MRNLAHLAARLYNTPLLLHPNAADAIGQAFRSMLQGEAPPAVVVVGSQHAQSNLPEADLYAGNVQPAAKFDSKPYTVTADGIALLPVLGPLVQRAGQITPDCMPVTSYQRLAMRFEQMQADPDVKGILMEFDGPGGEAAGMFDFAQQIVAARSVKPVWGHVNEAAFSATYGLAAAVDRLQTPQAGMAGSIGVVMLHMDQSQRDAKQGLVYTPIFAGARKVDFNSHAPLSPEAQAAGQAMVNLLYDQFTTHVASARSIDLKTVRGTEAGILSAGDAKAIGLIDGVASFADTLAELTDYVRTQARAGATSSPTPGSRLAATTTPKGKPTMADSNPAADQAATETARAEGHAAGLATGIAQGRAEGATAERTRIGAILGHEAAGKRTKLATKLALETDMAADTAVTVLQAAAEEPQASAAATASGAGPLATAMSQLANPKVGADGGPTNAPAEGDTPQATAKNVVSLLNQTRRGAQA